MPKARKPKPPSSHSGAQSGNEQAPGGIAEQAAPYARAKRATKPRPTIDLKAHEAELKRLVSFLDLAEGFRLAFAECNFAPLRDALIAEAGRRCSALGARVATIDLSSLQSLPAPLDAILQRVPEQSAEPNVPKLVLMLCGLESHVNITDEHPAPLVALNLARDALPTRLPHPLVIWLPDYLLTTLSRVAPDLWAWRSSAFRFPAPEAVTEVALQETLGAQERILDSKVEEVKERIHTLEALLQEYLPSVGPPSPDKVPAVLDILNELGQGYDGLGMARRALDYWERMLDLARTSRSRQAEGWALGNLGLAYAALGETRKAIECHEEALAIDREIGDRRGEGQDLGNLGIAYAALGETRKAIEFFEQHLAIARGTGDRGGEARASWNLGLALEKEGDLARAVAAMEICVAYERELGHPDAEKDAAEVEALRARLPDAQDPESR